jgi:protein angel
LLGYKGAFKKRTTDEKNDGCAIYYRENKFEIEELVPVEYYQPNVHALNRDNVGLIARLKPKDNPLKNIVVATTHLLFNPRRHDVKLAQTQIMLAEIERIAFKCNKNG